MEGTEKGKCYRRDAEGAEKTCGNRYDDGLRAYDAEDLEKTSGMEYRASRKVGAND